MMKSILKNSILIFLLAIVSISSISAQVRSIKTSVSHELVSIGDRLKYTINIENMSGKVTPPDFENFDVVAGPMTEQGSSNIHGKLTSYTKYNYFLSANKVGNMKIKAAKIETDGKIIASNSVTVKVVASEEEVVNNSKKTKLAKGEDKNVFARIYINKSNVFKGEQVVVTYVLYNRYRGLSLNGYDPPQLKGFWKEDVKIGDIKWEEKYEKVNGIDYQKAILARQVLFPQKIGKLTIGPLSLSTVVRSGYYNVNEIPVKSNTVSINVKALPKPIPNEYAGAVGNLQITANVDKNSASVNEAITLKVQVSGKGNLKLLTEPELNLHQDFEVYDPKINDAIRISGGGMSGSRTYEYLMIPRYSGDYTIDPISITYFNPKTGKYSTITTDSIEVKVDGSDSGSAHISESRKKEVDAGDVGLRYIKNSTRLRSKNDPFPGSFTHKALYFSPILLLILLWFYKKRKDVELEDMGAYKIKRAGKKALNGIKDARKHLDAGKKESFYESIFDTMNKYLSEKLGIPYSELSKNKVKETLAARNIDQDIIDSQIKIMNDCEMSRFAPMAIEDEKNLLSAAEKVILNLENELK